MKRNLTALIALALVAVSFSAQAGDEIYKAPAGNDVISTKSVYKIESGFAGGNLLITYTNGGSTTVQDPSNLLLGRILQAQPEFTRVTGTNAYVNPQYAARVSCSGSNSVYSLQNSGVQVIAADGCAMAQLIANKAK